jgi:hypothetical protein
MKKYILFIYLLFLLFYHIGPINRQSPLISGSFNNSDIDKNGGNKTSSLAAYVQSEKFNIIKKKNI